MHGYITLVLRYALVFKNIDYFIKIGYTFGNWHLDVIIIT